MNKYLAATVALLIASGGYVIKADAWVKTAITTAVNDYCNIPADLRADIRTRVDADIAPHKITIDCGS